MNDPLEDIAESGLQFFGKMTASISHEIKNVLAIINENAGLLEDFALMAEGGAAIEPERLKTLSHALMKQVERADTIVKNMNRFAHSTDASLQTIDLDDVMRLLTALSNRIAVTRGITLNLKLNESAMTIRTSPFLLMNLLWLCLDFAIDAAGEGRAVELATQKADAEVHIRFKPIGCGAPVTLPPFPAEREQRLLALLKAELEVSAENREVRVKLSRRYGNSEA
jgi:C4-dicarboxylate-specific signal transduction histidine kinase